MVEPEKGTESVPTAVPWRTDLSTSLRIKFFLTGVLYPIACLATMISGLTTFIGGQWQDGNTNTYLGLLLSSPPFCVFFPVILFSMAGLGLWCVRTKTYQYHWVRLAIYTGVFLTIQFNILLWCTTIFISPMMGSFFLAGQAFVVWLIGSLLPRTWRFTISHILILTTVLAVILALCIQIPEIGRALLVPPSYAALFMVCGAPFMAMLTFIRVAVAVHYLHWTQGLTMPYLGPTNHRVMIGMWIPWLAAWATSWKFAIDVTLIEYSKLPTTPPQNCFISQAAAGGHPGFVGSTRNPARQIVSAQMARCKLLELVLVAASPRLHRIVRSLYNKVGPPAAAVCRSNIWLADLAFLLLKPIECLAVAVQKSLNVSDSQVYELYEIPHDAGTSDSARTTV